MTARGELETYQAKRNFGVTPEPKGCKAKARQTGLRYLIQRHAASRLHYDFRIEHDGVLKSWAVTKAPSRDPHVKRLAVEVEDHPLDYGGFEGTIPAGNYGAGTVQLWDVGEWTPQDADIDAAFAKGAIKLTLDGERLKGGWALIRLKSDRGKPSKRPNWLLIKEKDAYAVDGEGDALAEIDASVVSGRSLAQIAEGETQWTSSKATTRKSPPKPQPSRATHPLAKPHAFVPIQLCQVADRPPSAPGWAHEIKFDGYRIQVATGGGRATLRTRKGLDWTDRFPELAADAAHWPDGVLDGELCALDDHDMPDFSALQTAISEGATDRLVYFAFDLLFDGSEDLRRLPLSHRKARLQALIDRTPKAAAARLRYVEHFGASGQTFLESACRMNLEGVISKTLDAPYRAGRSAAWVKSKCRGRDEVLIGGWSSEGGTRFRSLLVGVKAKGGLRYLGRVGTGYSAALTKSLLPALKAAAADRSPFVATPEAEDQLHWVAPVLVAEIEHAGYSRDGLLRQAAFKGLRQDKAPADVTAPPQPPATKLGKLTVAGVTITHPDKILWPALGDHAAVTKADLIAYYEAVAERLLPHILDRPVSIIRAPDGIDGQRFFQRHALAGRHPGLHAVDVGEGRPYLAVTNLSGLIAVGQSGGLELHPWGCKPGDPETPDQITFDLDPDEGLAFDAVVTAANLLKPRLEALNLTPFVKTTGGKGLHVVVPIKTDARSRVDWDQAKAFAKGVSEALKTDHPDRFTTTLAKKARSGKIFLDYLRNGRAATAVAPWSPRARPGAGIACPLSWDQVKPGLDPTAFTLLSAADLLQAPDPWADFRASAASLKPALRQLG
ncbi:DNA ligase D [uncultured Brevundimonas sp.]|uniref:DNA ligase D n=1 Tax=uncultured Brevundimonas sp. TaxID=213418 RepID=UPI0025F3BB49|nr:DNA ligase D [uncultured Brevundimonas sp.]